MTGLPIPRGGVLGSVSTALTISVRHEMSDALKTALHTVLGRRVAGDLRRPPEMFAKDHKRTFSSLIRLVLVMPGFELDQCGPGLNCNPMSAPVNCDLLSGEVSHAHKRVAAKRTN
jgi:hypothetical protein